MIKGVYKNLIFLNEKCVVQYNMGYVKAEEVLPLEIIEIIQEYVEGQNIYEEYVTGTSVAELADNYYLSEKSIQRIVREFKKMG